MSGRDGSCRAPRLSSAFDRIGSQARRHLLVTTLLTLPLAMMLGSLAGLAIARAGAHTSYRAERLEAITEHLHRIDGDYLLALGDSHIAYWQAVSLCGLPVVNAGVAGATAHDAAELLTELPLPHPPRAIILTIGTNDANGKRFRGTDEALARFRAAFQPLLKLLSRKTDLVIVTGVPPLDTRTANGFSAEAAAGIGEIAEATCRATEFCRALNPFREGVALVDGIHLRDYTAAYERLSPELCATLAPGPTRPAIKR